MPGPYTSIHWIMIFHGFICLDACIPDDLPTYSTLYHPTECTKHYLTSVPTYSPGVPAHSAHRHPAVSQSTTILYAHDVLRQRMYIFTLLHTHKHTHTNKHTQTHVHNILTNLRSSPEILRCWPRLRPEKEQDFEKDEDGWRRSKVS